MSATTGHDEIDLLRLTAKGDEASFRLIYDRYRQRIYAYAFGLSKSEERANEVVQDVFLKLWLNRDKLDGVLHFNAWLHTVARNSFLNVIKKIAADAAVKEALPTAGKEGVNDVENFILSRENDQILQAILNRLPQQQRQVFELRHQGLRQDEIAAKLNISKNTVKVHLNRALKTIRDALRDHTDTALAVAVIFFGRNF